MRYRAMRDDLLLQSRKENDKLILANTKLLDKNTWLEKENNKLNNLIKELEMYLAVEELRSIIDVIEELKVKYDIWRDK